MIFSAILLILLSLTSLRIITQVGNRVVLILSAGLSSLVVISNLYWSYRFYDISGFASRVYSDESIRLGSRVLLIVAAIFLICAWAYRPKGAFKFDLNAIQAQLRSLNHYSLSILTVGSLLLYVFSIGINEFLSRDEHLVEARWTFLRPFQGLLVLLGIVSAFLLSSSNRNFARIFGYCTLFIWLTLTISAESRISLFVLLTLYLRKTSANRLVKVFRLGIYVFGALIVFYYVNEMRHLYNHGFLHLDELSISSKIWFSWAENLAFIAPVIGMTLLSSQPGLPFIITSINPLPGFATDWSDFVGRSAIASFVPFSGLGLAYTYSPLLALLLSAIVALMTIWALSQAPNLSYFLTIVLSTTLGLLLLLQYQLRSGLRFFWLALAVGSIGAFVNRRRYANLERG